MTEPKNKTSRDSQRQDRDIDEASAESFPASDAPAFSAGPEGTITVPPEPPPPLKQRPGRLPGLPGAMAAPLPKGPVHATGRWKTPSARREAARLPAADPRWLARMQGVYFVATGVWPLLHLPSFERVTGGKRNSERWLVKTVGVLAASIGSALLTSAAGARQGRPADRSIKVLGTMSALGFLGIDLWYVSKRRISRVYLADAVVEAGLALGWLTART